METEYVLTAKKRGILSYNAMHIFDGMSVREDKTFTAAQFIRPATGMLVFEADAACKELVDAGLAVVKNLPPDYQAMVTRCDVLTKQIENTIATTLEHNKQLAQRVVELEAKLKEHGIA